MESSIFRTYKNEKAPGAAPFLLALFAEDSLESPVKRRIAEAHAVQNHRLEAPCLVRHHADHGDRHENEGENAPDQDACTAEAAIETLTRLFEVVHRFSPRATMANVYYTI